MDIDEGGAPSGERSAAVARRRRLLLAIGAVVVVAVVVLVWLLSTRGDEDDGGDGAAATDTSTSAPSSAPTSAAPEETVEAPPPAPAPTPTGAVENADELPPALPEVPLDAPAAVGNGVVATITSIEAIEGTAVGPGNIAGPALRVTVGIENGTDEAISLGGVAVNLSHGPDRTPASPLDDPSQAPFSGTVEPGASSQGVYVFTVPTDVRDFVTVEVGYEAGAPLLLFTGSAA